MSIKVPLVIFILLAFFSCDKKEDKIIVDPIAEETIVEDETKPVLTIVGFTDIIEISTSISVSIVDESSVETKVVVNDQELIVSTEKQLEISVNPFVLPVGQTDFLVVSTDAKGNETSEIFSVEVKHLLMTYSYNEAEDDGAYKSWVLFNDLEGAELAAVEVVSGEQKIYTNELVQTDKVLFSLIKKKINPSADYKDILVNTYELPLSGKRSASSTESQLPFYDATASENVLELTLNGVAFTNNTSQYNGYGSNYAVMSAEGDEQFTKLNIGHEGLSSVFIRPNSYANSPSFDGKKENYSYIMHNLEPGDTNVSFEQNQLQLAVNTVKLDLPEFDENSFSFKRDGLNTNGGVISFQNIYEVNTFFGAPVNSYIDLPVISGFNSYLNRMFYEFNGFFYITQSPNELDVNLPNWNIDIESAPEELTVTTNNPEVDYYSAWLSKEIFNGDASKLINWYYNFSDTGAEVNTIKRLQLPQLVLDELQDAYFENLDDLALQSALDALDYAIYDSYDQVVDWLVFNTPNEEDVRKYRILSIPTSSTSGKNTNLTSRWNLDNLQRYGLE